MSNSPIVLYRGDREVEVRFTIVENPYNNKNKTNILFRGDLIFAP